MTARSMTFRRTFEDTGLVTEMNITPLIDVLLVLLVMMILTVPVMNHKIPVELPQPGKGDPLQTIIHRVDLSAAGTLAYDGVPIADAALPARLTGFMKEDNAQLQIAADAHARYERFDQTLGVIRRAGVTRLGFIGNDRFAKFGDLR